MTGADARVSSQKEPDETGDPYEDYPDDQKTGEEDLAGSEIVKIATDLKGIGNTAFKSKDISVALGKYQKGLRYLNEYPEPLESDPPDMGTTLNQLKVTLYSNSALCYNKQGNFERAISSATSALEVSGATETEKGKAYYRRALAKAGTKDEEEAMKDLEEALKCVPGDSNVTNELNKMKKKVAEQTKKEKAAYQRFFQ